MLYFKAKMPQIRIQLQLHPRPQHTPGPPSWVQGVLLLREGGERRKTGKENKKVGH